MKYTREQRIEIGRQICEKELSHSQAMAKYGVVSSCIDTYVRLYKTENGIPTGTRTPAEESSAPIIKHTDVPPNMDAYMAMSKEELIRELILAKANELRAKKGYEVKGVGANKEYVSINNRNTKS